jgi:hypothetical protein
MHFLQSLVGATALLSTSVFGANIPAQELETRTELEARHYQQDVDNCKSDLQRNRGYKYCKSFYPTEVIIVKKVVFKKKGTKTIKKTKIAPCTTSGHHRLPPSYHHGSPPSYYGKRDALPEAEADADVDADAEAGAAAEAHYWQPAKCHRKGCPEELKKYSCAIIKKACKHYYKPKIVRKTVSEAK